MTRGTTSYFARDGKVYAATPEGEVEAATAMSADGRDLERHDRVLQVARAQREAAGPACTCPHSPVFAAGGRHFDDCARLQWLEQRA